MKSSLWAAPRSLVYRDKISCHWVQGFPSNEGVKEGYPLKRRHFAVIGSNNVKTVADRYIQVSTDLNVFAIFALWEKQTIDEHGLIPSVAA